MLALSQPITVCPYLTVRGMHAATWCTICKLLAVFPNHPTWVTNLIIDLKPCLLASHQFTSYENVIMPKYCTYE